MTAVVRELKRAEVVEKLEEIKRQEIQKPTGLYDVIVIDPPWPMQKIERDVTPMLVRCDPQFGIHKVIKNLKGYTSRVLRQEFPHLKSSMPSLWTNSYFVAAVGSITLGVVKQYIESQKKRGE